MDARQDQIAESYGIRFLDDERGTSWVVMRFQIAFLRSVRALEQMLIRTQLVHYSPKSLAVEAAILADDGGRIRAYAWTDFVHISTETARPIDHDREYMDLVGRVCVDGVYDQGFGARAADLRALMRDLGG